MKKLLIFDFDGTICDTLEFNYRSINHALQLMSYNERITKESIKANLGKTSEEYYSNILPDNLKNKWQDIRNIVRDNHEYICEKHSKTFPYVRNTLNLLNKNNYNLAICSNAGKKYLEKSIEALGIKSYFKYIESTSETNTDKKILSNKINNLFSNPETYVIGDKYQDIEAAKVNDFISIGCLYGYGKNELDEADYKINEFKELINILKI